MKTEKQISNELKAAQKSLADILKKPSPDFEKVSTRQGIISALQWVLRQ